MMIITITIKCNGGIFVTIIFRQPLKTISYPLESSTCNKNKRRGCALGIQKVFQQNKAKPLQQPIVKGQHGGQEDIKEPETSAAESVTKVHGDLHLFSDGTNELHCCLPITLKHTPVIQSDSTDFFHKDFFSLTALLSS